MSDLTRLAWRAFDALLITTLAAGVILGYVGLKWAIGKAAGRK